MNNASASPVLHLICGKAASGKSTLTEALGKAKNTITLSEDDWLNALFGDEMQTLKDYVRCSAKLKRAIQPHIEALLAADISVVLDFPANTIESRKWMPEIINTSTAEHVLHFLDVSDEVCKARLRIRNQSGEHPFTLTDEQFEKLSNYFEAPSVQEGFNIKVHRHDE